MPQPLRYSNSQGFSLPEVMVSSMLLCLVVANTSTLYFRSQGNIRNTSLRDAINTRIAADLEKLRQEAWKFGCKPGTACTGEISTSDKSIVYDGSPATQAEFEEACKKDNPATTTPDQNGDLAQFMVKKSDSNPQGNPFTNGTLDLSENNSLASANIVITRSVSVDSADPNKLNIAYTTPSDSPVRVNLKTSIVPQVLGWCS